MIPSPILRVLSSIQTKRLRALVMGGQACILYGGAQFSRDLDLALSIEPDDLRAFSEVLGDLQATRIAVPPFSRQHLLEGHAIHFRCFDPHALHLRLDVMTTMRGVAPFTELWGRRTVFQLQGGVEAGVLSLPDLVAAKKTQRDKDWPMIRALIESDYYRNPATPSEERLQFWLREARTPAILIETAALRRDLCEALAPARGLLTFALQRDVAGLQTALSGEEAAERALDRKYWAPLKKELEELRKFAAGTLVDELF